MLSDYMLKKLADRVSYYPINIVLIDVCLEMVSRNILNQLDHVIVNIFKRLGETYFGEL